MGISEHGCILWPISVLILPSDYSKLTVDTNTVQRSIKLSNNNRMITTVTENQPYPAHPERFKNFPQLLCSNSITGNCYWEVGWTGQVYVSVAYKRICGSSPECWFGENNLSWSLVCSDKGYSALHNNIRVDIPFVSAFSSSDSQRVAVYVNYPAGILSFYTFIAGTLLPLHTFNTTFTEPLYPGFGFGLWPGSSVYFCWRTTKL